MYALAINRVDPQPQARPPGQPISPASGYAKAGLHTEIVKRSRTDRFLSFCPQPTGAATHGCGNRRGASWVSVLLEVTAWKPQAGVQRSDAEQNRIKKVCDRVSATQQARRILRAG